MLTNCLTGSLSIWIGAVEAAYAEEVIPDSKVEDTTVNGMVKINFFRTDFLMRLDEKTAFERESKVETQWELISILALNL